MSYTRIKICGITSVGDASQVIAAGADALGLVFYAPSPRAVVVEQAREIATSVPAFVTNVALFVDATTEAIEEVLSAVPIDLLQFHGNESEAFCRQFGRPYIKAIRVREGDDVAAAANEYVSSRGVLLDTWEEGVPGGTGKTFDWSLASGEIVPPLILAGGLNPFNVAQAVAEVRPAAVDVSGGVELRPGVKDPAKILDFVAAVRSADEQLIGL